MEWNPEPRTMNETTNRPTNEHAYADVMEQPRHEPAPSMQSDFFTEAARGGVRQQPSVRGRDLRSRQLQQAWHQHRVAGERRCAEEVRQRAFEQESRSVGRSNESHLTTRPT